MTAPAVDPRYLEIWEGLTVSEDPPRGLNAARFYCGLGWYVVPIRRPDTKHPDIAGWQRLRLTEREIDALWAHQGNGAMGLLTGHQFDVLDVDNHDGKPRGMDVLGVTHGRPLPHGPIVLTPSGGYHFYVQPIAGMGPKGGLLPGVDYRGLGGQVLAPPSETSAGRYKWMAGHGPDVPIPQAPEWLPRLSEPTQHRLAGHASRNGSIERPDIAEVAARMGLQARTPIRAGKVKVICPFHDNRHEPSMEVDINANRFKCFSADCGAWGDSLDLRNGVDANQRRILKSALGP